MGDALVHILVVLVAAKVAAEAAERLGVPAVAGEIVAGIAIGPSVLGLVHGDEVLRTLGEIGVLLLLLQVGMEMDLADLRAVGRASLLVAVVGVAAPFVLGAGVSAAFGHGGSTAVFVGAALTATSVGITARVFGDLRALATVEARVVLGAAVADDILGLIILTVVVRAVSEGSVSPASVAGVVVLALLFLVVVGGLGTRYAPALFSRIHRLARSPGTLIGLALAFTLGAAQLATTARLAPIIGAFVAGLSLGRWQQAERVHHELAPLAHVFVPVFFLQIGIDTDLASLGRPEVLGLAAALFGVAVVGKLVSGAAAVGTRADKLSIGLGMLPRGEVGLIFAGLGKEAGVLGPDLYGALLVVVLGTTLVTPPLLAAQLRRSRAGRPAADTGADLLAAALEAALAVETQEPDRALLDRLAAPGDEPLHWDRPAAELLVAVLRRGNARSWRFLEATGVLARALPEVADALDRRRADPLELDVAGLHRWVVVDRLHDVVADPESAVVHARLDQPDLVLLAAFALDAAADEDTPLVVRRLAARLRLGRQAEDETVALVVDRGLLAAAARRLDSTDEGVVLQLAGHLGTVARAAGLYLLSLASGELDRGERMRLDALYELVHHVLAHGGADDRDLVARRRAEAEAMAPDLLVRERVAFTPPGYVLAQEPTVLARQARLLEPLPGRGTAHVEVTPAKEDEWVVDVVCRDRSGLLAVVTGVLADVGADVVQAAAVTWPDGGALESFLVRAPEPPDPEQLRAGIGQALRSPLSSSPTPDVSLAFDDDASPWHTICDVQAPDRPGLLHALAAAFARAGVDVLSVQAATSGGVARDRFELTDSRGHKLDVATRKAIADALATGTRPGRTRRGRERSRRVGT